ncbi:protein kinase domain-containing protein [Novipirellula sp. SH528]|uniref:protein kinase domain-containing protein n=1 Tax=Novipirellula sp. SH528 TaxID=3454466 RepID=UPI003FA0AE1A
MSNDDLMGTHPTEPDGLAPKELIDPCVEDLSQGKTFQNTPTGDLDSEPKFFYDVDKLQTLGRYELREELGRGGFGAVYVGFDPKLDREVAIKIPLLAAHLGDVEKAFLNEARRLAQLRHHGIVTVHDVGVDHGCCYIVSEYLQGYGLYDWLKQNKPTWQQVATIVAALADALAHAHSQSTIHRDIKPGNIILVSEAEGLVPKLVDFGLAISESHVTGDQRGRIVGTPAYMSPEQTRGHAHRIDGRTDIYSLGIVLYEMLCGQLPFRSAIRTELTRRIREDAPQPPRQLVNGIPSELEDVCLKAISKKEDDRYRTAGDMASALRAILQTSDSQPHPPISAIPDSVPVSGDSRNVMTTSASRRARDAERRQLTVMICNCDATNLEESLATLDPEEQREVLTDFRILCEGAVGRFGGTVIQSTGQEMLVCFGYPIAYEDAPHRAIRSGLRIMDDMKQLNKSFQKQNRIQLSAWAAIHTGVVVVGSSVDSENADSFSIVGDARNVISRLEALTEQGQVIISEATHLLVKDFFVCKSRGSQKIRGIPQPIELFQIMEEGAIRSRVELVDPVNLTPLVGRDMELGIIKDRWEHAKEGSGQVVLLIGDAGLGKSRLVREIKQHLADETANYLPPVIEWRCSAYHSDSTLHPVTEFFKQLLGFSRNDSPESRLDKLVHHLQELQLDDPDQIALFASLLSVPPDHRCAPITLSPSRQKERTQALLLEWLRQYSSAHPVLLIVEDLHWVDPSTLEFLSLHVDEGLHDSALTLLTFRPEFRTPWQSYGHQTQVALTRLTKRQIGELIQRKTGIDVIPSEVIEQLAERTDGVPLFVEEFTQMVQDSGALDANQKGEHIAVALSTIPVTLHDLLAARLDRMDSDPNVVQLGATFGREFTYELMHAASELQEEVLQEELAKLVEAELLFQKGRPPSCSYIFKHALIQDAAYNSVLKKKRQQFHKTIAETIENGFEQTVATHPELLAHHYAEADETAKAVAYYLKAGQYAQQRSANTEAIHHLMHGLEVLESLSDSPQRDQLELSLQLTLAPVLMAARGWSAQEVGTAIERAQRLVTKYGTLEDRFFVMWGLWGWRLIRADMDICDDIAKEVMQLVVNASDGSGLLSEAYWVVGATAYYKGDLRSGLDLLEEGLKRIEPEKERESSLKTGQRCSVLCRSHAALALWQLGFPDQALQHADETIRRAREQNHPFSFAMGLFFRRQVLEFCGLVDQAQESIEEEYAICHENGFVFFETHAIFGRGNYLLRDGNVDEASEQFEHGLKILRATGGNLSMDHPYRNIAEAYLLAGIPSSAKQWIDRGFDLVNSHNERGMESEFLRLRGEWSLAAGDEAKAEESFREAIKVAQRKQAKSWELRSCVRLVELTTQQGKASEARKMLETIYEFFTEGFQTSDLVRAKTLLDS